LNNILIEHDSTNQTQEQQLDYIAI